MRSPNQLVSSSWKFTWYWALFILGFTVETTTLSAQGTHWEPVAGPDGGGSFLIVPDTSGQLYTMTTAGLYRSSDTGKSWVVANAGLSFDGQVDFAIDSSNNLYEVIQRDQKYEVYRSTNSGESWGQFNSGLPDSFTTAYGAMVVEPGTHDVYFSIDSGLYRIDSTGLGWEFIDTVNIGNIAREGVFYSSDRKAVYRNRRSNGFTTDTLGFPSPDVQVMVLTAGYQGELFVGTVAHGILRSTDDGETWEQKNSGLATLSVSSIVVSPGGKVMIFTDKGPSYESQDNGDTWIQGSVINSPGYRNMGWYVSEDHCIIAGTYGPWRTTDGGLTWRQSRSGIRSQYILSLAADRNGSLYAGTYTSEIFRSTDDGESWELAMGELPAIQYPKLAAAPDGTVYFTHYSNAPGSGLYRSTNGGSTWTPYPVHAPNAGCLLASDSGLVLLGAYGGRIFQWLNDAYTGLVVPDTYVVESLGIDSTGAFLAGSDLDLYRSTNRGQSWSKVPGVDGAQNILVDPQGRIIIGNCADSQYTVMISSNNGRTWKKSRLTGQKVGHNYSHISGIVISDSGTIVVSTNDSLAYYSIDHGTTWKPLGDVFPYLGITWLAKTASGGIFAGTFTSSVYRVVGLEVPVVEEETDDGLEDAESGTNEATDDGTIDEPRPRDSTEENPRPLDIAETRLHLPFPNPFQGSLQMRYDIAHDSHVILEVFNVIGERVALLMDAEKNIGRYSVDWEPSSQANGYYFVRLRADGVSMALPVVLMR